MFRIRNYFSIFHSFFSLLFSLFTFLHSHILSFLSSLPSFYPFPPLLLPSFIPLRCRPSLSRSVRYCLKSWAAVWWLKRWQIDTFTHDRTPVDRAQGERGSDEQRERERASEGEGQKNNKLTTRRPLFPQAEMDGSEWMSVCFFSAPSCFIHPLFQSI